MLILVLFLSGLTGPVVINLCDFFDKEGISPQIKRPNLEILKICIDDIPAKDIRPDKNWSKRSIVHSLRSKTAWQGTGRPVEQAGINVKIQKPPPSLKVGK